MAIDQLYDEAVDEGAEDDGGGGETVFKLQAFTSNQQVANIPALFPAVKSHNNYASGVVYNSESDVISGSGDGITNIMDLGGIGGMEPPLSGSHYPMGDIVGGGDLLQPGGSGLNVRAEEIGLVLLVLLLWVGAVALFFNR